MNAARLDNTQQPGEKWALFTLDCECVASICVAGQTQSCSGAVFYTPVFSATIVSLWCASDLRRSATTRPPPHLVHSCHKLLRGASGGLLQRNAGPVPPCQGSPAGSGSPGPAGSWAESSWVLVRTSQTPLHPGHTRSLMGHQTKVSAHFGHVIYYMVIHDCHESTFIVTD